MDKFIVRLVKPTMTEQSKHKEDQNTQASTSLCSHITDTNTSITFIEDVTEKVKMSNSRSFNSKWMTKYSWIMFDPEKNCVFCTICKNAFSNNLIRKKDFTENVFIEKGFSNWKKAIERFNVHEKSEAHLKALLKTNSVKSGVHVGQMLLNKKQKEMQEARIALVKIFSSIRYLATQGLSLRGHTDKRANLNTLISLRADDVLELNNWMKRDTYKWLSHEIQNEMIEMLANEVLSIILKKIKKCDYYAVMLDESADISCQEQVSLCFRVVNDNFDIEEYFTGFYNTSSTTSETLFKILLDVLTRFDLPLQKCRGQCYDGASNVSGCNTGLQARVYEVEQRALFVHCTAHSLNLVIQDSLKIIPACRDLLNVVRELITFIRGSPKRLAWFSNIQGDDTTNLRPFCPTRWILRAASLKSILFNYEELLTFLEEFSLNERNDAGTKANGFLKQMHTFDFFFTTKLCANIFERLEVGNIALQKSSLHLQEACEIISKLNKTVTTQRNEVNIFWETTIKQAESLGLQPPELPRYRRPPRKLDTATASHQFSTPFEFYRLRYNEVFDNVHSALNHRFETKSMQLLSDIEAFICGDISDDIQKKIADFYKDDLNIQRLILHLNMFRDLKQHNIGTNVPEITSVKNILDEFKKDPVMKRMLPEMTKFLQLILTIPTTTCTAERSFSCLRRLKTYLRSTMGQLRLNSLAVLNIYPEIANQVDLEKITNDFIIRTAARRNAFEIKKKIPVT